MTHFFRLGVKVYYYYVSFRLVPETTPMILRYEKSGRKKDRVRETQMGKRDVEIERDTENWIKKGG